MPQSRLEQRGWITCTQCRRNDVEVYRRNNGEWPTRAICDGCAEDNEVDDAQERQIRRWEEREED
ncbi:hypothetical protein QTI66_32790 [Variovorax sp. J22R133]|uniref:hypothetical protein n=1 Tax=Variovorax brevis TaxID=3053503 RepID=UPI002577B00F|nr:hypothetical protein [Variovorax sp. J22R133]MDM0116906.1 hypothetical protein [Variovorax sp. J22R133]